MGSAAWLAKRTDTWRELRRKKAANRAAREVGEAAALVALVAAPLPAAALVPVDTRTGVPAMVGSLVHVRGDAEDGGGAAARG